MVERKSLSEIEVGDRVWLGSRERSHIHIRTVRRLTPTQIVLPSNYRYYRSSGIAIGAALFRITEVATSEECQECDEKLKEEERKLEARRIESERLEAERQELNNLFGESAYVERNDYNPDVEEWHVHIFLSKDSVGKLAEILKNNPLK
jgi:hypothetical protein